ncbi:MAG: hypothetical protein QOF88_3059 [Mycobacterium sp.]|nr:hypothetical protein [Mycobacterium sp.]
MARPSWANTLGCRDFELTPLSMRPFWNESRKRFPELATRGGRRRARLRRCTSSARSHAAGPTAPEAGESTRSAGEDEAGSRPEHRAHVLAVLVHLPATAVVAATATTPVMAAAGVRAEDEATEEDDRDDEHGACHDADPRGDGGESARPALVLVWRRRWRRCRGNGRRRRGFDGTGRWFGGRGCFAHVPHGGRGSEELVMNCL